MTDDYIERQWRSYRDNVMPASAPKVQIIECKRAFFADAMALGKDPGYFAGVFSTFLRKHNAEAADSILRGLGDLPKLESDKQQEGTPQ